MYYPKTENWNGTKNIVTISLGKVIPKHYTDRIKSQFGNSGIGGVNVIRTKNWWIRKHN